MISSRRSDVLRFGFFAVVLLLASAAWAAAPSINKVEPPNWWVQMPRNPMLVIYGEGLQNATVRTRYAGVKVARVLPQPNGRHLFVWLSIGPNAAPGTAQIEVRTAEGAKTIKFPLLRREPLEGRAAPLTKDDVLYLIMPDRFANGSSENDNPAEAPGQMDRTQPRKWHGGDVAGVRDHLDYIRDLGATAVWLTPWWKQDTTTSDYHGYHVVDYYAVEPHLGTMDDLRSLSKTAHQKGMKVVIDFVVNHAGPLHPWANDPPTSTWLHGSTQSHLADKHDFQYLVDPHATNQQKRGVLEGWFAGRLPDLNVDDPLVEEYLTDNAIWWMESAGLDSIRLDTFPYSSRKFWSGWHQKIFKVYPKTMTIGEVMKGDPWITSFFVGGRQQQGIDTKLTTVFDFPLGFAIRDVMGKGESVSRIVDVLQRDSLYESPESLVTLVGNHDTSRILTFAGENFPKARAAMALQLTMRGIPQIYAGDEIAMSGGDDPDNRRDFPGGWSSDQQNAFTPAGRTDAQKAMFTHTQTLLRLRREHPALRIGKQWSLASGDTWYAYVREALGDRVLCVFNNSDQPQTFELQTADTPIQNANGITPLYDAEPASISGTTARMSVRARTVSLYLVR